MNPKAYCQEHNMPTALFVARAREVAPKYSKITHSMASNPDYGVVLRPAVARHIRGVVEHRRNPCRVQFRVTQANRARLTAAAAEMGCATMQDLMTRIVTEFLARREKESRRPL